MKNISLVLALVCASGTVTAQTALDWSDVVPQVMPSAVSVSVIKQPRTAENNRAWLVPGVKSNLSIDVLNRLRALLNNYADDEENTWFTNGAGFLIDDGRYVLTAAHVLEGSRAYRVKIASGEWRSAQMVGFNEAEDIGLLLMDGEPGQPIRPATSLPRQGQPIMAIGTPAGHEFSASAGIVSRLADDGFIKTNKFLQIDAPITGGNSGGAVVNAKGEAVGVMSYAFDMFAEAVPINRAMRVADELKRLKRVRHIIKPSRPSSENVVVNMNGIVFVPYLLKRYLNQSVN